MSQEIRIYAELREQIHDELRIQHPEWVEPNGESSMCLLEELDALTRSGSNESIAAPHRALEHGLNRIDTVAV
jgi:hypothetical protein